MVLNSKNLKKYGYTYLTEKFIVPDGITKIAPYTFLGASNLKEIVFPEQLEIIGTEAFYESGLVSISFPKNLKSIGDNAFSCCRNLSGSLIIPDSVKKIGTGAFMICNFTNDLVIGNGIKDIETDTFSLNEFKGRLVLSNCLKNIDSCAFEESNFKEVFIPESTETINENCFAGCCNEINFYIPFILYVNIKNECKTEKDILKYFPKNAKIFVRLAKNEFDILFKDIKVKSVISKDILENVKLLYSKEKYLDKNGIMIDFFTDFQKEKEKLSTIIDDAIYLNNLYLDETELKKVQVVLEKTL